MTITSGLREDFLYGFATAAAQIEGGGKEAEEQSGRGLSIWDTFCDTPGKIADGTHVNRTCNHLELYKEDIALMKSLGANAYRFSLSWPRIVPLGGSEDPINEQGIDFYNNVINECLKHHITPFVTLYHWDLPLELFNRYGGWLDKDSIIRDFTRYARVCYERFGDRVKHWLTLNEPWCTAVHGHGNGQFAPGHVSNTEPWIVGHNLILGHAHAAKLYINEFKPQQGGIIGITLNGDWCEPYDDKPENIEAAQRKMDFALGWFADPIYLGRYPQSMIDILGDRLPKFTKEEFAVIKDSSETYTTNTIKAVRSDDEFTGYTTMAFDKPDGSIIGLESELDWHRDVPWGFRKHLNYLYQRYQKPIYMTENGWCIKDESKLSPAEAIRTWHVYQYYDVGRVKFYEGYTRALKEAVEIDRVDVRSYFGWSFLDNFEWASGLVPRFGSVYCNYETFERTPKDSARSLMKFFIDNVHSSDSGKKHGSADGLLVNGTGAGTNHAASINGSLANGHAVNGTSTIAEKLPTAIGAH
ncbi:hypothetical protein I316_06522 [Kwoniella heveanensis BCC8398]|uniref:Beta-glucosidase n=1 Tax=Kwoniella heveanensis BCC8398 TaxID=1296120 RepID=A0A1B9GLE0_9TREE|nr:hypothetical protein I316_06522 [Kwoniella heveanensis BCC8398]